MNFRLRTAGSKIGGTNPSSSERRPWTSSPAGGSTATTCTERVLLLQIAADAHQRAARTEAGDEHVDLGAVAPDLGAGALVVGQRVGRVAVLEQAHQRRVVGAELLREPDRAVAALLGGRQHDLGAEDLEQLAPLDRHVLGHDHAQPVAAQTRHHRQADAGVARRRLEDRVTLAQQALLLGELHHLQGDAVLRRSAGVLALELGEDPYGRVRRQRVHPDQRGVADDPEDVFVAHGVAARVARRDVSLPRPRAGSR